MRFLSVDDIHFLHGLSIDAFGGTLGVRDVNTLESAVYHPRNVAAYGGNIFEVAAAYAFHIAEGQCFLDGNKRTAAAAALNFLANNEVRCRINDEQMYDYMIGIAEKRYSKAELADYFRRCSSGK